MIRARTASVLVGLALVLGTPLMSSEASAAAAAPQTGTITGVVRDSSLGKGAQGALVIVECICLNKQIETYTNSQGLFAFRGLAQGIYTVNIFYGDRSSDQEIRLAPGGNEKVRVNIEPNNAIVIDVPSSSVKQNANQSSSLDQRELLNLPGAAPGGGVVETALDQNAMSGDGAAGKRNMIGSTFAELDYQVDGANASDVGTGSPAMSLPPEFIGEVTVLGAGYDAEFGGYSGGVVQARRVSGTNVTRGIARLSFIPRLGAPRFVVQTDNALRAQENFKYQLQGLVAVSGPIIKDKLYWSAGITSLGTRSDLEQSFYARIDKNGSGGYEDCPYNNGDGDCVDDGDYIATRRFAHQTFKTGAASVQAFGGLDWSINAKHRLAATFRVAPSFIRRSYRRPLNAGQLDPDSLGASPTADPVSGASTVANGVVNDAFGWDRANAMSAVLNYKGRVAHDKVEIDATLSFSQTMQQDAWRLDNPELKNQPAVQTRDGQGRNLFKFLADESRTGLASGIQQACNEPDLPIGLTCPVRSWLTGGIGQYQTSRARRIGGNFSFTHFFSAAGHHQLKYGAQLEHAERQRRLAYSGRNSSDFYDNCEGGTGGGEWCYNATEGYAVSRASRVNNSRFIIVNADNPDQRTSLGFGRVRKEQGDLRAISDPLGAGARVDAYDAKVSKQYYGLFLQDKWAIRDNLFLSGGMRWDIQDMRDVLGKRAILIWDSVAPRTSISYDWTNEGKSRLYASYGWFYQKLPLSLINRVYGGQVNIVRSYRQKDCNQSRLVGGVAQPLSNGDVPTEYCTDTNVQTSGLTRGATVPHLRGQYDQQFTLGYEHEVIEDLTVGVSWLHRDLQRAVEDVSPNGGGSFIIANPGESVSGGDIRRQQARCEGLRGDAEGLPADDPRGAQLDREIQRCDFLVGAYERVGSTFDRPTRNTDVFALQITKRFGNSWRLGGSYTFSRVVGNYEGFVDPITGAINLGSSTQYDTPDFVRNSFGPLSYSSPHRLKIDGFYIFDLKEVGTLAVGASVRLSSGYPVSMRGASTRDPNFPIYVLPRGTGGRLKARYQANLSLQYSYPIVNRGRDKDGNRKESMAVGVAAKIFNVTNAKAVLRVDEVYTLDNVRPIAGGTVSDLKHARVQSATRSNDFFSRDIAAKQGNYGVEAAFQTPIAARFDLTLQF